MDRETYICHIDLQKEDLTHLIEIRGLNMISFGFVVAIPAFAGAIATIMAGWLVENIFKNREKYFAAASMVLHYLAELLL